MSYTERDDVVSPPLLAALVVTAVALAGLLCGPGCRTPAPGTIGAKVVDCSTQAVRNNWPAVLPSVNSCLVSASASACLLGLVQPAAGVTFDLVACLVRDQGSEYAHAAQANTDDVTSAKAASNARNFLAEQQVTFADGTP